MGSQKCGFLEAGLRPVRPLDSESEEEEEEEEAEGNAVGCKNCGRLNPKWYKHCMQCGEPMPKTEERPGREEDLSQGTATEEVEEDAEDSGGEAEEEGEEGRKSRGMRDVIKVSREEKEDHERTHTPYRPWCRYCVQGRGRANHHRKREEKGESEVPRISMDYFFMSKEDEKAHRNPLVVMIDEETG